MNCSPFDLRDYLFGELAEPQRRQVDLHVRGCSGCHEDLERLRTTSAALMSLGDEEVPQRIGFVSDKIFEPSPARRAWRAFWGSTARLGFASAAMLSLALAGFTFYRPVTAAPIGQQAVVDTRAVEARVSERVSAAVEKAVAESETRQVQKTAALLDAAEKRFELQRAADMERVKDAFAYIQKLNNVALRASYDMEPAR